MSRDVLSHSQLLPDPPASFYPLFSVFLMTMLEDSVVLPFTTLFVCIFLFCDLAICHAVPITQPLPGFLTNNYGLLRVLLLLNW